MPTRRRSLRRKSSHSGRFEHPGLHGFGSHRTFARALLGSVGQASAEQIENSNGALRAGDTTGTGGLQQKYDSLLRGKDGVEVLATPPR